MRCAGPVIDPTFTIIQADAGRSRPLLVHVPHSSVDVPERFLGDFALDASELAGELLLMTDRFTDELAASTPHLGGAMFVNQVSRLVMDPERFENDALEPMSGKGMGAIYVARSDGGALRRPDFSPANRGDRIRELYRPYHAALEALTEAMLARFGACWIVDMHSFPQRALPYEDASLPRPSICIGFDDFHVDEDLRDRWDARIRESGLDVRFNEPFAGSLVPARYWNKDPRVRSLMIEVRRDLYMDSAGGRTSPGFAHTRTLVSSLLSLAAERSLDGAGMGNVEN